MPEETPPQPPPPPPLPLLGGHGATAAPASAPSWAMAQDIFPLDASVYKPPPVDYAVFRSPMRRGTLHLSEEGVRAEGRGQPDHNVLATAGGALWLLFFAAGFLLRPLRLPSGLTMSIQIAVMVSGLGCSLIAEYRTIPRDEFFGWDRVQEVWFDQKFRRAAVIYATEDAKGRVRHRAIPLQFRDRSLCGALRDSVERFAPGKTRVGGVAYAWTPRRIAIAVTAILALAGFFLWLLGRFPSGDN